MIVASWPRPITNRPLRHEYRPYARPQWSKQMKRDLYSEVSARIIAELERGAAAWIKPWSATAGRNVPANAVTNRPY
jgi:antirestriction protein ArdC